MEKIKNRTKILGNKSIRISREMTQAKPVHGLCRFRQGGDVVTVKRVTRRL